MGLTEGKIKGGNGVVKKHTSMKKPIQGPPPPIPKNERRKNG